MTIAHKLNGTVARHSELNVPVSHFLYQYACPEQPTVPDEKVLAEFEILRQKEMQHLINLFREASTKTPRIRIS